ncbi:excitatory amino acid transporter 3-like isoform X2 [Brachyhypopomus gauderio]|uniref:excitatory amino acid transporter 3-like isoform X2 n=1 Tax=Brachyhypopomus gauderio TaxID=698409 RepID=UPI00404266F9
MAVRLSGFMKKHWLFLSTMLSVSLGVGLGVLMRGWSSLSTINRLYFGYPGNLLMQLLKMITLPLICSSMITGVAAMDSGSSGKIGLRTIAYTLSTTITAIILGMILATVIKPGTSSHSTEDQWTEAPQSAATVDTMLDLIRNLIPENLVQACFQQYKSTRVPVRPSATNASQIEYKLVGSYKNGMNILGILTFCILLGLALGRMGKRGKRFVEFFSAVNEAIMRIVKIILCYMPVGIIFLIATKVIGIEDWNIFRTLGFFMLTVLIGSVIYTIWINHFFIWFGYPLYVGAALAVHAGGQKKPIHIHLWNDPRSANCIHSCIQFRHPPADAEVRGGEQRDRSAHQPLRPADRGHHQQEWLGALQVRDRLFHCPDEQLSTRCRQAHHCRDHDISYMYRRSGTTQCWNGYHYHFTGCCGTSCQ